MKIQFISDTHCYHKLIEIEKDIDCLIHGGDSTSSPDLINNTTEFHHFKDWFINLPIKHKIIIAGNHDRWATKKYNIEDLKHNGIIYLEHEYYNLEGLKIFGSPYTPTFGQWFFMVNRNKLDKYWKVLEPKIDILITHGPPKGILDLSYNKDHELEYCGDKTLFNYISKVKPKYHLFGHIHNNEDCYNQGIRIFENTTFINGSCMTDNRFRFGPSSHGIKFEI